MYLTKSCLANNTAQAVGATTVQTVSDTPQPVLDGDSKFFLCQIKLSELTVTTGVTFKLQHATGDGVWYDVGSSANAAAVQKTCTDSDVNATTNKFAVTAHGWDTGTRVLVATAGTLPAGLDPGEAWIIRTGDDEFKLAASLADALAGDAIDISDAGSGTFRFGQADYTIRLLVTDSTDVEQLPLWPALQVVCATGADDSATVSELRRTYRDGGACA